MVKRLLNRLLDTRHSLLATGRRGFTLLELTIYAALFSVAAVAFVGILVTITQVQVKSGAQAEVNQQSQFLLQTIQRYVETSSLIDMATDSATTTLKLRMSSSAGDPAYIYLSAGTVYLKETEAGAPQALTSDKVNVSSLSFIKRANSSGRDSLGVSFTVEYNSASIKDQFSQGLNVSVARVSAATFDSNVIPSTSNTYKIGVAAGDWQSINNTIFFNSSNVGIGANSPTAKLQVNNGDIYVDTAARGLILRDSGGSCWRLTVNSSGTVSTASLTCP